jgi:hypothetical protein
VTKIVTFSKAGVMLENGMPILLAELNFPFRHFAFLLKEDHCGPLVTLEMVVLIF